MTEMEEEKEDIVFIILLLKHRNSFTSLSLFLLTKYRIYSESAMQ